MGQDNFKSETRLMNYVEAWFDNHPEPENIVYDDITEEIRIFYADGCHDIWLINISLNNARAAAVLSSKLKTLSFALGIEQILIGNRLFLFEDQRF